MQLSQIEKQGHINPPVRHNIDRQDSQPVSIAAATHTLSPLPANAKKAMLQKYMQDIIKGCTKMPPHIRPLYRIVSGSSPASGKTSLLDLLKHVDRDIVALDRDRFALYHPKIKEIMTKNQARWASDIRDVEKLDHIIDNQLLNSLMAQRYNIINTENNILPHIEKAEQYGYQPRVTMLKIPRHIAKMRSLRRFLFPEGNLEKKRLVPSNRFDLSPNSYEAHFDQKIKNLYKKRPNTHISALYQTADKGAYKMADVKSYKDYKILDKKINKPPKTLKDVNAHNQNCSELRQELEKQFPQKQNKDLWRDVEFTLNNI